MLICDFTQGDGHETNSPLTKEEQRTLLDASRYAPESRFRQWAHAVYLNRKGYRINQLADIFVVNRDTVSGC